MDEQLLRSVHRQLRAIQIMLGLFFLMFIAMIAVLGYMTYKVVTFTHNINTRITNFENKTTQSLDFKKQICGNKSVTGFLGSTNELCE